MSHNRRYGQDRRGIENEVRGIRAQQMLVGYLEDLTFV